MNKQMSISKLNIFTGNIAHPLVNLLTQHRRSSGNSAYSFSRLQRLKGSPLFLLQGGFGMNKQEIDPTYPFTAAFQKQRCLVVITVSYQWNLTFLPNKAQYMCKTLKESCVLTMVQTCVFVQAKIADI